MNKGVPTNQGVCSPPFFSTYKWQIKAFSIETIIGITSLTETEIQLILENIMKRKNQSPPLVYTNTSLV